MSAAAKPTSTPRDSANVDFVRSVAVLAVLSDHVLETLGTFHGFNATPLAWYLGRMGVLLFFVLTSLVLLISLERSARSGRNSAIEFYLRRGFRIYPLSIVCVLIVVAFSVPSVSWDLVVKPVGVGRLLSNLALTMDLTWTKPVLSVLWSLPYELQMYLALPAIFWFVDSENPVRNALALFGLGIVAALVQPGIIERLGMAQFAPCFMAGAFAYAIGRVLRPQLPFKVLPVALFSLMGIYCLVAWAVGTVHPRWLGWTLCLAIGGLLPFVTEMQSPALRVVSRQIAKYSYGIYLFHMIALWVGFNLLRESSAWLQLGTVLLLLVALPVAGHHLIEKPGIDAGVRLAARLRTLRAERANA